MGTLADSQKNAMLAALAGQGDYVASAAVYAKLHVGAPGSAGTNNPATDTTRQEVVFGDAPITGEVSSTEDTVWTGLATADPDTLTHVSFWDDPTAGTFLGSDDLPVSKDVGDGDTFTIFAGDITLSISDS